jgi:hypothetical protein
VSLQASSVVNQAYQVRSWVNDCNFQF